MVAVKCLFREYLGGAGDVFGFEGLHGDEILLSRLPRDNSTVTSGKEDVTALRLVVSTIIGLIGVRASSETIVASEMQVVVGRKLEILKNSFGGGHMTSERSRIVSAKSSDCE